ncbi:hypothetical protein FS837_010768 [Tulasnella sp. UAMH 9824]|nr:hypothetical protein FS837_010768 [Tulasnella sp. UAMH 9824]
MFRPAALATLAAFLTGASAQQVGTNTAETHPALTWYNTTTCAKQCALDGADYSGTYGITTSGNALTLKFVTPNSNGKNVGSCVYLMADDNNYEIFKVLNQEFTFDVDVSQLPCGLDGAVYFSEMDADGGMSKYANNKAGAKYGTGYCDSQCPRDLNATPLAGLAPLPTPALATTAPAAARWTSSKPTPSPPPTLLTLATSLVRPAARATLAVPQAATAVSATPMGDHDFYGPGKNVDTTKKFTVVTQFITSDNTATGTLTEIKRYYIQNGVVIANSSNKISGISTSFNSITGAYCDQQKAAFGDTTSFQNHGGLTTMGQSLTRGGVLVLSVWDDYVVNMLWLDSTYPTNCTKDGCYRGTCATTSGVPADVEVSAASATVTYSNVRVGPIGSTFSGTSSTTTTTSSKTSTTSTTSKTSTTSSTTSKTSSTTTTTASGATQTHYGQCGGIGYT